MKKYYNAGDEVFTVDEVHNENMGMNSDYDSFVRKLLEDVRSLGFSEEDASIEDDNGRDTLDVVIRHDGDDRIIGMRLYPDEIYDQSQEYGYDSILAIVKDRIIEQRDACRDFDLTGLDFTKGYENLKDYLIVRPLNFRRHAKKLKNGIYIRHGDVALVLYAILQNDAYNLTTHMVDKTEIVLWGKKGEEEQILEDALKRTAEKFPAFIFCRNATGSVNLMDGDYRREDVITPTGGVMLSNEQGTNGAAAMFYPGVSKKIAELMHGKYAAVFMNTTDVMIVRPDSPHLKGYMEMAAEDNEFGEMLSGRKYLFDQEGKLINA